MIQPPHLDPSKVYAKEQALLNLCHVEKLQGRQVWVYVEMTDKRDIQPRLAQILQSAGLSVKILRKSVKSRDRMKWIAKQGPGTDVVISYPGLVETGVDFFDKEDWTFNFPTIVFYQCRYKVNMIRQAGHRHHRIGQTQRVFAYRLVCRDTVEEKILELQQKKRDLADAILNADNRLIQSLTREDLEFLLT